MSGAPPESGPVRKFAGRKNIFCLDVESIPQDRFLEPYEPDPYWLKEQLLLHEAKDEPYDYPEIFEGEPFAPDYPCKETGQLPATHPTTGHVVSVSTAMDYKRQGHQQLSGAAGMESDPPASKSQVINLDDYLPALEEIKDQIPKIRPPRLAEINEGQLRTAERSVIRLAFEQISWAFERGFTLVTFNGKGFDLPMLRWRAAILGLTIPKLNWYELLYPYRHKEHIDLRLLFSDGDRRAKGTLTTWARAFGLEAEESGHQVLQWVQEGRWDELRRYGGEEMPSLINLFRAVEPVL